METNSLDFLIKDGVLIKYIGRDENVIVPFGVRTIGPKVFEDSEVKTILVPNSVTTIDPKAFVCCKSLIEIKLPCGVIKKSKPPHPEPSHSFGLTNEVYISNLTDWCNIGFDPDYDIIFRHTYDLYSNGELIKEFIVPNDVAVIKEGPFIGTSFEEITVPAGVTKIEKEAFSCCLKLKTVNIEGELQSIGPHVFYHCHSLKRVTVCSENMKKLLKENNVFPRGCKILLNNTEKQRKFIFFHRNT